MRHCWGIRASPDSYGLAHLQRGPRGLNEHECGRTVLARRLRCQLSEDNAREVLELCDVCGGVTALVIVGQRDPRLTEHQLLDVEWMRAGADSHRSGGAEHFA